MKKVKTEFIKLKKIKHIENSRLRDKDDVAELMADIEQRGLMQPIGVRLSDNALIYGNRRVKAYEKLGYDKIQAEFYDDLDDDDLLIANVVENIQRKSIGSIEIGRICKMLMERGYTKSEIAQKLCVTKNRVQSAVGAYNVAANTPFADLIVHNVFGNSSYRKGIPESVIWKIQNSLSRAKRLTKSDWNIILKAVENGELITQNISTLRKILMTDNTMPISKALDIMKKCQTVSISLNFNRTALYKHIRKEKMDSPQEFVNHIIKKYDKELLF